MPHDQALDLSRLKRKLPLSLPPPLSTPPPPPMPHHQALDLYPKADLPATPADDRVMRGTLLANCSIICWLRVGQAPLALADRQMSKKLPPPISTTPNPPLQALDMYPEAAELAATPADDRALDLYPKADLAATPVDDRVMKGTLLANRSICWLRLGQAPLALADGQMSRSLRPDWPKAYFREGTAFRAMERYEDAANVFFEGVQVDPNNMDLTAAFQ
ncbi:unnamed protein product [Closterium sp. Naga37s-1]|nr:unnamed protein product [Closterium sp. Naga37s-1]